jgi:hypothetical protein
MLYSLRLCWTISFCEDYYLLKVHKKSGFSKGLKKRCWYLDYRYSNSFSGSEKDGFNVLFVFSGDRDELPATGRVFSRRGNEAFGGKALPPGTKHME